ncbi:TPA: hypothetical protein ACMDRV_004437 [Vibrio parahaemolyticus]
MDINKLLDETKNSITEQLSSNTQTKQSIICSNLENIEALSSNGVSYRKLLELCNISIELKHFHDLIYRAKKKRANTQANASTANTEKTKVMPVKASPQPTPKKENIDIVEWKMIMPDISEFLVRDIVKEGYSIQDAQEWISANQLPNSSALRRFFSALKAKNK